MAFSRCAVSNEKELATIRSPRFQALIYSLEGGYTEGLSLLQTMAVTRGAFFATSPYLGIHCIIFCRLRCPRRAHIWKRRCIQDEGQTRRWRRSCDKTWYGSMHRCCPPVSSVVNIRATNGSWQTLSIAARIMYLLRAYYRHRPRPRAASSPSNPPCTAHAETSGSRIDVVQSR